jgi:hypothetical protein
VADLLNAETLLFFTFFVVPGFVTISVYDLFVPAEQRSFNDQIVEVVAYSLFIVSLWSVPFLLLLNNREELDAWLYYALLFTLVIAIIVISPALLGYGFYRLRISERVQRRLQHPSPTPWDYFFEQGRVIWVRFHMKEGDKLGAFYGEGSFASSFPHPQQIYVTELYRLDEAGRITEQVEGTAGAIINMEDCELIEFLEPQE